LFRIAIIAGLVAACTPRAPMALDSPDVPTDRTRGYTIWLGGARVGTATETETWSLSGVVLRRVETMRFLRGNTIVSLDTTIEIAADRALVPYRASWTERGANVRHAEALREGGAWTVDGDLHGEIAAAAIPAELAPMLVARDGHFAGHVFLPARGFVVGTGRIDLVAPRRFVARVYLADAIAEATIDVGDDGMPARVVDGDGVIAVRATADQLAASYPAVDVIAATSIPITGTGAHIVLDTDASLPAVPGQSTRAVSDGVEVSLSSKLPGALPPGPRGRDRSRDIAELVSGVRGRIEPDLGAAPTSAKDAAYATAGDCTTFALAYAALAIRDGIPTKIVTGFRIDDTRLIRHRWAASWTGHAWIAVDAAFGAAPAGGNLIGLAIHDADDAGLVTGEAALTHVRHASRD